MRQRLLTGVAALALVGAASVAWAQPNTANDNTASAISQDNSADAVAATQNAVDDGGVVAGGGNAVGEGVNDSALANDHSTATQVDLSNSEAAAANRSLAIEDGAVVGGDGAAVGDDADLNAVVGGDGTAVYADDVADDGSSFVSGNHSDAASAEEGGAAVVGGGLAVGIDDVTIESDDATVGFGQGNVVASAHLEEVTTANTAIGIIVGGSPENGLSEEEVSELQSVNGFVGGLFLGAKVELGGAVAVGPNASVTTGDIAGTSLGSLKGANMWAANSGIANQGDAIGVAAKGSF